MSRSRPCEAALGSIGGGGSAARWRSPGGSAGGWRNTVAANGSRRRRNHRAHAAPGDRQSGRTDSGVGGGRFHRTQGQWLATDERRSAAGSPYQKARETIEKLGYSAPALDQAALFYYDTDFTDYVHEHAKPRPDWPKVLAQRPQALAYSYRQSPVYLDPTA